MVRSPSVRTVSSTPCDGSVNWVSSISEAILLTTMRSLVLCWGDESHRLVCTTDEMIELYLGKVDDVVGVEVSEENSFHLRPTELVAVDVARAAVACVDEIPSILDEYSNT